MGVDVWIHVSKFAISRPKHNETELIAKFEQRTADLVRIPHNHAEQLQVLGYNPGGFYHVHDDATNME